MSKRFSRQKHGSRLPFPSLGDLSNPEIKPGLLVSGFFTSEPPRESYIYTPQNIFVLLLTLIIAMLFYLLKSIIVKTINCDINDWNCIHANIPIYTTEERRTGLFYSTWRKQVSAGADKSDNKTDKVSFLKLYSLSICLNPYHFII